MKRKPSITIIGPGRLGMALALALSKRNYLIQTLVGREQQKIKKVAQLLDVRPDVVVAKDLHNLNLSDLVLITTPDDQISNVVKSLTTNKNASQHFILHTSGALSSEVLEPLAKLGWHTGSIHPLVSVSDPLEGAMSFAQTYWCLEGDVAALKISKQLVRDLKGKSFSINSTDKPLYHAAAVMTSGNVVAVFDIALDMLTECGLSRSESQSILLPLLRSTVDNLVNRTPSAALTGTFSRGDVSTVDRHLKAISKKRLTEAAAAYRLLGKKSLKLAGMNGLDSALRKKIQKKLNE